MIITNNESALRLNCQDVTIEEYKDLKNLLEKELAYANKLGKNGIGLAAPQIGLAKKIAIIRMPGITIDLVNAQITKKYDEFIFREEGCLSFPGRLEDTKRFKEVHISNNLVEPYNFIATDLLAVVCQHELDHLNSNLFFDHKIEKAKPIVKNIKIGPNDPCFCGSNKKYKKCCR
jgi:peptide deformylase